MKPHHLVSLFLLVSLSTPARADGPNRASQIFTRELAQKILGTEVVAGSTNGEADTEVGKTWVSKVSYSVKDGGAAVNRLTLLVRHGDSAEQSKGIFESSKATFKGVDVAGLGDAAYRTDTPAQLNVLKGSDWLIISAGTTRTPDPALQEKLAREVLAVMK